MLAALRPAIRSLLKSPGYTVTALLTLALSIGINTSMLSTLEALLFRSAPFPDAPALVQIVAATRNGESRAYSFLELSELREQAGGFAALTTLRNTQFAASDPGQPAERLSGTTVSADFSATFRVAPLIGRMFEPEEFQPGRNQVVLLSHAYWMQRFAGSPEVIGRTMRLDGENVTILGVMPPTFDYPLLWGRTAFWRPLNFTRDQMEWRDYRVFTLIGRLPVGGSFAQVAAQLAPAAAQQEKTFPESYSGLRYNVLPLHEALMDSLGRGLSWMLLGLAGFVLLIACANLANLQLARATAGLRELAIRVALGASRARLIGQQLLESVLLALVGGLLGLGLALGLNGVIDRNFAVGGAVGGLDLRLDPWVVALTLLVALVTGILFGIAPAWFAARTDVNSALKQQSRGTSAGRGHQRVRQALIVAQMALTLVLLGGAAILERGFARLLERPTGWDTERIITATLPIPETRVEFATDPQRANLFRRLEERLARIPRVEHAAIATSLPLFSYNGDRQILIDGQSPGEPNIPAAYHVMVTADYFATLGIPLVEGQLFERAVKPEDPRVIVINEALARRLWPARSAIGQRIGSMDSGKPYWAQVIGVVRDVDSAASTRDPGTPFQIYKPLAHEPWSYVTVVLRSAAPASLAEMLRRAIAEVDPDLAAAQVGTVRQIVDQRQRNLVLATRALTAFALLGLALATVGLYGVISNLVEQRTGEFGIRLALGARPVEVLSLVLRQGLMLCAVGVAVGLVGAFVLSRFLAALLPRVASFDLLSLAAVACGLLITALLASWLPARRATKVNPLDALRAE